jgi:predicted TIM-barrel fold metal-dependent hydrolase
VTEAAAQGWDCHVHVFSAKAPTRDGHYRPVDRPLAEIEQAASSLGARHLVLVQPSVYGTDNSLMLSALAQDPGRHRGVAVVADGISDDELDGLHAAGVRGVRLNLVSPVGEAADPATRFAALAARLQQRKHWHLQWYTDAERLPLVAQLHRRKALTCVLDHLAGLGLQVADDHPAWQAVEELAAGGAWLKLSGWYRLGAQAPYTGLVPRIRRLAGLFGERMVWGSDWPHTLFAPSEAPDYAQTWHPVVAALGSRAAHSMRARHPPIYA